jgi:hypothetical protein
MLKLKSDLQVLLCPETGLNRKHEIRLMRSRSDLPGKWVFCRFSNFIAIDVV